MNPLTVTYLRLLGDSCASSIAQQQKPPISAPCTASVIVYAKNRRKLCGLTKYTHELLNWPKFEWDQRGLAKQLRPSVVEMTLDAKRKYK